MAAGLTFQVIKLLRKQPRSRPLWFPLLWVSPFLLGRAAPSPGEPSVKAAAPTLGGHTTCVSHSAPPCQSLDFKDVVAVPLPLKGTKTRPTSDGPRRDAPQGNAEPLNLVWLHRFVKPGCL